MDVLQLVLIVSSVISIPTINSLQTNEDEVKIQLGLANDSRNYDLSSEKSETLYLNLSLGRNETGGNATTHATGDYEKIFRIIYYVCKGLSIACLGVHLTVYYLLPSLHNFPGKMVVFMSVGLLVGEVLEVVSDNVSHTVTTCYIFGMLLQYVYVSVFAWINVMAYDIQRAFRSSVHDSKSKRRFLIYSVYGWGFPALLAAVSVTLFAYGVGGSPGTDRCYVAGTLFLLITGFTIVAMLLANVILFVITACSLCKTARETKMAAQKDRQSWFALYAKLAVVLGLTWVVLILSALTGFRTVARVAQIPVELQGVFVFVVFTCKKKVWRMLGRRFGWFEDKHDHTRTVSVDLSEIET